MIYFLWFSTVNLVSLADEAPIAPLFIANGSNRSSDRENKKNVFMMPHRFFWEFCEPERIRRVAPVP